MGKKRKIISLIVSVAMLVAMLPMIVHADEETGSFTELQAEIDASGGNTVTLTKNYEYKDTDTCGSIKINSFTMLMCGGFSIDRNLDAIPADGDGHVFTIEPGGTLMIMNMYGGVAEIKGGYAENGGGILVEAGGNLQMYDNISITENTATQYGGGVYIEGSVSLTDSHVTNSPGLLFTNNTATNGKDVYLASSGSFAVSENTIIGDLLLAENKTLSFADSLSGNASIGISTESELPYHVTSGCNITDVAIARRYFSSPQGTISLDSGEILISSATTVSAGFSKAVSMTIKQGIIGLNFLAYKGELDDSVFADSKVTFEMNTRGHNKEKTVYTADAVKTQDSDGNECYKYSFEMSPLQLNEDVKATLSYGEGESLVEVDQKTCSAMDYINACTDTYDEAFRVVYQVFNLGYYLQAYLGRVNGWASEPDRYEPIPQFFGSETKQFGTTGFDESTYQGICSTIETSVPNYKASKSITDTGVASIAYALEFDYSTTLVVTFTLKEGATGFEVPSEDNAFEYTVSKLPKNDAGQEVYRVRIPNIYAQNLDNSYDIKGHCSGDENDFSVHVCPMGYVYSVVKKSTNPDDKRRAMGSVFYYWNACENYCN